jgi:hypothetical protein
VEGHSPFLYQSGTAGAGSNATTIVDTTKSWTTNQWAGFTAKRVSDNQVAYIISNTSNTLTVSYYPAGGAVWALADQYQIHKLLIALDQPCRGKGNLITGSDTAPVNSTTGTPYQTHQVLEPCYSWNDKYAPTNAAVNVHAFVSPAIIVAGRDFFNNTPMPGYTPYIYPHPLTRSP